MTSHEATATATRPRYATGTKAVPHHGRPCQRYTHTHNNALVHEDRGQQVENAAALPSRFFVVHSIAAHRVVVVAATASVSGPAAAHTTTVLHTMKRCTSAQVHFVVLLGVGREVHRQLVVARAKAIAAEHKQASDDASNCRRDDTTICDADAGNQERERGRGGHHAAGEAHARVQHALLQRLEAAPSRKHKHQCSAEGGHRPRKAATKKRGQHSVHGAVAGWALGADRDMLLLFVGFQALVLAAYGSMCASLRDSDYMFDYRDGVSQWDMLCDALGVPARLRVLWAVAAAAFSLHFFRDTIAVALEVVGLDGSWLVCRARAWCAASLVCMWCACVRALRRTASCDVCVTSCRSCNVGASLTSRTSLTLSQRGARAKREARASPRRQCSQPRLTAQLSGCRSPTTGWCTTLCLDCCHLMSGAQSQSL
jgi:hypothetical protein